MSEISGITTTSNKFAYNQSEIITAVNDFFSSSTKQIIKYNTFRYSYSNTDITASDELTGYLYMFHIYGYIHKEDISAFKAVKMKVSYVSDYYDPAVFIQLNPQQAYDYFDITLYRTTETTNRQCRFIFNTLDKDNNATSSGSLYSITLHIDVYQLA